MSQTHSEPDNRSTSAAPGMPRWVKVSGVVVVVVIILFAILHLSGAHGPASHLSSAEPEATMTDGSMSP